ncbi:TPA: AIPR family protein [Aeromonas salmonicida subsp. pectinolytica]
MHFYSGISDVNDYITDGHGDHSCDIILDKKNSQGDNVFYLIQSKWNNIKNCSGQLEKDIVKSYLSDAQSILRGDKEETANKKFNSRYDALKSHIRSNGEVKVIYLTLKNDCIDTQSNIKSFESFFGGRVSVECFDINRLKLDYIDRNFKKSTPPNPLEKIYNPEFEKITINIVRDDQQNLLKINSPFPAHVFNILPKTIYELVLRYGVSLFDKNIRNPLVSSKINAEIVNSLKNDPSYFWYYNNGITAITRAIPAINSQAESFQITGLQIINGAQTAYSIYLAYSQASLEEREIIDSEARITLRLLKSGGKDFDLKVTKYTNSQNPVSERDFWSTDPLQIQIKNYFYSTNVWYEKRSVEFRKHPKDIIKKIPNTFVASAHLAFWLSNPVLVFDAAMQRENKGIDLIFTSYKENKDGLYERIFNKDTKNEHIFASFCIFDILTDSAPFPVDNVFFTNAFHIMAISKIILKKYLSAKYTKEVNICNYIINAYQDDSREVIRKCIQYSSDLMKNEVNPISAHSTDGEIEKTELDDDMTEKMINLMTKSAHFEMLMEKIEKMEITTNDIDNIVLKEHEADINEFNENLDLTDVEITH